MHFRNQRKTAQDVFISDPIDTDKEGNSLTLQDIMSDDENIFDHIDLRLQSEQMYRFIDKHLSPREKKIIIMRYGLFCTKPLTQREVAKTLGISRSYVSRPAYCKQCLKKPVFMRVSGHCFFLLLPPGSAALIVSIGEIDKNRGDHSSILPKHALKQDKPGFPAFLPQIYYTEKNKGREIME